MAIQDLLAEYGQSRLLQHWDSLSDSEKQPLEQQLQAIDWRTFQRQQALLHSNEEKSREFEPFGNYYPSGDDQEIAEGKELIKQGQLGCLMVAGGQGTRLKFDGPKGMFPLTEDGKTLFQIFAERTLAASEQAGIPLKLAIMTSPHNDAQTRDYFAQQGRFGLEESQLSFFSQAQLPFLDDEGQLFLDSPSHMAEGPDGNGVSLHHFVRSGIWEDWNGQGVRYLNFIQVDNVLADPFDANLLGHHCRRKNDMTLKCILREDPKEKVGVIVEEAGKAAVVEYSEISPEDQTALNPNGGLLHALANISQFGFSMDFVKRVAAAELPLHLAHKAVKYLNSHGQVQVPDVPRAWKFEAFIFDVLKEASQVDALVYPREECYAPLKNVSGADSIETVRLLFK